jgi:hypothetical protein
VLDEDLWGVSDPPPCIVESPDKVDVLPVTQSNVERVDHSLAPNKKRSRRNVGDPATRFDGRLLTT